MGLTGAFNFTEVAECNLGSFVAIARCTGDRRISTEGLAIDKYGTFCTRGYKRVPRWGDRWTSALFGRKSALFARGLQRIMDDAPADLIVPMRVGRATAKACASESVRLPAAIF